jgi:hypothetical protein
LHKSQTVIRSPANAGGQNEKGISMVNPKFHVCLLVCLGLLFGTLCTAQTETARLQGTITDPSGAVVVGATVTATNVSTGRTSEAQTNDSGY